MTDYPFFPGLDANDNFPPAVRQAIADAVELKNTYALKTSLATKADLVNGVIPTAQIPAIALNAVAPVANRAAMLALTSAQVQPGDVAVDTSTGATRGSYILTNADPSVFTNWQLLNAPTDTVVTVNGQSGSVVLGKTDVGLSNVNNTADADKPVSTAAQAALDTKAALLENIYAVAASGAAVTIADPAASGVSDVTLTASATLTFPTLPAAGKAKTFMLILRQDATGARLVTWPSTVKWAGGVSPILSTGGSKVDIFTFTSVDAATWLGFIASLDVR